MNIKDVAARDNKGLTLLHVASAKGHVDLTRLLIERGTDMAAQDSYRWTLFFFSFF